MISNLGHVYDYVYIIIERRGQHQLNVKVNGAHIKNSPFTVTVYIPPQRLSQPVATISGLNRPGSLIYSQPEDKVLATLVNEGRVMKVDLQPGFIPRINDFMIFPYVRSHRIYRKEYYLCYH